MSEFVSGRIRELQQECRENCIDGDCADCCVMGEMNEIRSFEASRLSDEDLGYYCDECNGKHCTQCAISKVLLRVVVYVNRNGWMMTSMGNIR
jgi:hypothetical protein